MINRNKLVRLFVLLAAIVMAMTGCAANAAGKKDQSTAAPEVTPGPMEAAQELADYIFEHGKLPDNFIRKRNAENRGWKTTHRYVSDLGEGITIGGDYFGNYEEKLPVVKGRKYYEADCFYQGGPRNEYRIIYSTDGHVWFTGDHYETFIELFPTKDRSGE